MIACPMNNAKFEGHMEGKIEQWKAFSLHIGEDFAVFEFDYKFQIDNAVTNLKQFNTYYGYQYETGPQHRLVVINTL